VLFVGLRLRFLVDVSVGVRVGIDVCHERVALSFSLFP
jgi:hypothetical protein